MATPEKNPEPSRSIADGAELEAAYRAMREPVSPGNLPAAIWTLWARLERAEEALAASEPHTEIKRLRSIIAAALERVELLDGGENDGGENDGREAEAILKEGLDESKSHTPQLESRDSVVTRLAIQHPCNCGAAEDQDCRSVGCSGAQVARLNMLNKRIATTNDAYHTGAVDVDDPMRPPAGVHVDEFTPDPGRDPQDKNINELWCRADQTQHIVAWMRRGIRAGRFKTADDVLTALGAEGAAFEAILGNEPATPPRHLPQFTKNANLNWVLSCTCGFTGAADGYATLSNARRAFSTHVGSRPTVT